MSADARLLFDALRALRTELARDQSVPPYVIFHDATLRSIALEQPQDIAALSQISGVGASKLERYGSDVIATLAAV